MRPHYPDLFRGAGTSPPGRRLPHLTPTQIRHAYGFDQSERIREQGRSSESWTPTTIPTSQSDLGVFSAQFGLPACTSSNGCFRKVYSDGKRPAGERQLGRGDFARRGMGARDRAEGHDTAGRNSDATA